METYRPNDVTVCSHVLFVIDGVSFVTSYPKNSIYEPAIPADPWPVLGPQYSRSAKFTCRPPSLPQPDLALAPAVGPHIPNMPCAINHRIFTYKYMVV